MPIIIPNELPAFDTLQGENIFAMSKARAVAQDIRPLKILVVNLMPTKMRTDIKRGKDLMRSRCGRSDDKQ